MQPIAVWLVARPLNAILGLVVTLLLPLEVVISGGLMAYLVMVQGPIKALSYGAIASVIIALVEMVSQTSNFALALNAVVIWLPALVLGTMLWHWRSVNMTMQMSVVVATAIMLTLFVVVGDIAAFGRALIEQLARALQLAGMQEQSELLLMQQAEIATQMPMVLIFGVWTVSIAAMLAGYAVLQKLPEKESVFGRFCDLNFGRVLAIAAMLTAVLAGLTGAILLQNLAILLFSVFWIQGLAMVHWLYASGKVPLAVVAAMYIAIPLLSVLIVMSLALAGYVDAWFDFRKRATPKE